jgi:signal transduction histidine kinase
MISLRRNLTRSLLGVIVVLVALGLFVVYMAARYAVTDQFDVALRAKAQAIETLTQSVPGGATVGFTDRFFRGFDDKRPEDFFELWDEHGRSLARSESLKGDHLPLRSGLLPAGHFWAMDLPHGRRGRALGLTFVPRLAERMASEPVLTLIVATDRDPLDDNLELLIYLSTGCGAGLIGAILLVVPFVLRRGLVPLDQLGEQAAAIDSTSLSARFSMEELPEELRPIAGRLNDLLSRIELSFDRERRFTADLAHELRTPLSELRSAAECALKWPDTRDAAVDRETLAIALQMEGMVGHMLSLARTEQGQLKVTSQPIDFGSLVASRWERLAAKARDLGLSAELHLQEGTRAVTVSADPTLARAVVDNLLENAVEYTPRGGKIEITVMDGSCQVANPAGELDAEDLPRLFERFWRKEVSRTGGLHVGLGLPLSRAFAEAMGWTLTARKAGDQLEMNVKWSATAESA